MRYMNVDSVKIRPRDVKLGLVFFSLLICIFVFQDLFVSNVGVLGIPLSLLSAFLLIFVSITFAVLIKSVVVNLAVISCFWGIVFIVDYWGSEAGWRSLAVTCLTVLGLHCFLQLMIIAICNWFNSYGDRTRIDKEQTDNPD